DRSDDFGDDEIDEASRTGAGDDEKAPEAAAARKAFFPSSMGLSFLIADGVTKLKAIASWGDYEIIPEEETTAEGKTKQKSASQCKWQRIPQQQTLEISLSEITKSSKKIEIPHSNRLFLSVCIRNITDSQLKAILPIGTKTVSIFLVNDRQPVGDSERDRAFIFQAHLEIQSEIPFVPRPDPRSNSNDWDEMVADLQYRHDFEYATGHNVSADYELDDLGQCKRLFTTWIPKTDVEKVVASEIAGEYAIETLAQASDVSSLKAMLDPMVEAYQNWILQQKSALTPLAFNGRGAGGEGNQRYDTAKALLDNAMITYQRIRKGINAMDDPQVFQAFKLANQAIAISIRQRNSHNSETAPKDVKAPKWRPFQLAFILNNIAGIANPLDSDREIVDLLFFPTGGGKTEAYLGLAAFTLILRRLRDPRAEGSAGLSVLMRYTLRLLTLDQLGRAATLICALETIRQENVDILGKHRFEIGLWVGQTATPNRMGTSKDKNLDSARERTRQFKLNSDRFPSPIPLEKCPWCDTRFKPDSFQLFPNSDTPLELQVSCINRKCLFGAKNPLPIIAVDDQIYRKLPAFMIATVDKFANLPWVGETGKLFGKVCQYDEKTGNFYSEADKQQGIKTLQQYLPPPDLIIQDELHLISGPLGTMVGLYETAIDALCSRTLTPSPSTIGGEGSKTIRPKIVASTATVRRAKHQIRALFARENVDIFPPPSPDRRDSFFAKTVTTSEAHGRTYLGIAAQGRSLKVILLRTYLALLSAAQREWKANGGKDNSQNPADPYMTLLGYFNSLRELGGSRRIVEDEVSTKLQKFSDRRRISDSDQSRNEYFRDRQIRAPLELTSRVSTSDVADTKRRLELGFAEKDYKDSVDVALATNMISVGLDITRLGLMVVLGQPKTAAEYIQATSRVGRDDKRPGLVITLLNVHRPRDRSHYERFKHWHTIFYRAVEATSVTPFSPRAVDRGLAAITVALARHHYRDLTTPLGAFKILSHHDLDFVIDTIAQRAERHGNFPSVEAEALRKKLRDRTVDLLDTWKAIANERGNLQYQKEEGVAPRLLYDPLDPDLMRQKPNYRKFKAQRSLRDVEKSVNLWIRNPNGIDVEEE
ncbi:MAG: DISARM system helicase DrmA, partial [Pseudanabaena sp. ELA607]